MTETAKPKGKGKSPAKRAKAAVAEVTPEPKTYEWRGLTLELPAEMPGELVFDFATFEEQAARGEERVGSIIELLRSLVGEAQVRQIRAAIGEAKISFEDVFEEIEKLLDGLLQQYGMGLGKSSASPSS
jgi:hypothetical protein